MEAAIFLKAQQTVSQALTYSVLPKSTADARYLAIAGIGVRQEGSDCLSGQVFSCPSDTCFYGFDYFTLKAETTGEAYDFYKRDGGVQWYFSGGGQGGECFEPSGDEGECVFQTFTTTVAFDPILKCTGDFINY